MQQILSSIPGYKLHEYLLVLQPHEELSEKILMIKEEFAERFEVPAAAWGRPQVAIAKFTQHQMMEERLVNRLRMVAMAMPAFKVELKDFGSFPTHTIYINIETKAAIQMLVKSLKTAQAVMKTGTDKPHFMNDSHIAIARKLLPWQYEKAWLQFSHQHFTGRFIAKEMVLLQRVKNSTNYHPTHRFEFMNMPVVTTQGALF